MDQFLALLPYFACPLGMGLMMLFMSRSGRSHREPAPDEAADVARLRAEVAQLRTAHETTRGDGQVPADVS